MNIFQSMNAYLGESHADPSYGDPPYHVVPSAWTEEARRFKRHICEAIITRHDALVSVRPAYKNGPYKGFTWSGSFVITVRNNKPSGRYCAGKEFKFYLRNAWTPQKDIAPEAVRQVDKWWQRVRGELDTEARGIAIVALYRDSGLIPKHIAKQHSAKIRAQIANVNYYTNPEVINMAIRLSNRYIRRYGKCPKCGGKRTIMEHLPGYLCTHCGACWEDMDISDIKWSV